MFGVVTRVMGYDAVWVSSVDGLTYTARIGYKDPSEAEKLSGIDSWDPDIPYMEYIIGQFPGLKELVDKSSPEEITIEDRGSFVVQEVKTKSDGDMYVARLVRL